MNSLLSLRASVAEILAMSVLELFPGTILGDLRLSDTQFKYLFHFNQPKHPELLPLLEEKMRGIMKSHPLIEEVEMAALSAVNYFEHREQPLKAEAAELTDGVTVPMVRIGEFYDLLQAKPYSGDFSEVAFQLLEAKDGEISGTAFFSKEELKAFIKHRKAWLKAKPWEAPLRFELVYETALLPKGVKLLHSLERFWRKSLKSDLCEVMTQNPKLYPQLAERLLGGIAEWGPEVDLCYFLAPHHQLQQRCISSLQFIQETFNMLSLRADWVLCEKVDAKKEVKLLKSAIEACGFPYEAEAAAETKLELRIYDSLGERWPGPFLRVSLKSPLSSPFGSIQFSLLGPIKSLIALLAEAALTQGKEMKEIVKQLES